MSVFSFPDDNLSKYQWIFAKLSTVCALILWSCSLVLLMGKFRQFLTKLSALDIPVFSFLNNSLSKC